MELQLGNVQHLNHLVVVVPVYARLHRLTGIGQHLSALVNIFVQLFYRPYQISRNGYLPYGIL